jgi:hypothetical protein
MEVIEMTIKDINEKGFMGLRNEYWKKYAIGLDLCGMQDKKGNYSTISIHTSFGENANRDDIAQAMIAVDKERKTRLESWNTASEDQDPRDCSSVYVVTTEIPNDKDTTLESIKKRLDLVAAIRKEWEQRNEITIARRKADWEKHKDDWP